ncbi:MAG: tetratricopeptide repeat protein, partial [Candidatus Omnitrophica bacterium]|nr:tetratricopeptide repeat protein [Candidatus Omnitrophota bacterium]MBD3269289.1 tetratricopeptide repeat protein [Candidatus Omnitrophota bacterium]
IWEEFLREYRFSEYAGSVLLYLGGMSEKEKKYSEAAKYYRRIVDEYKDSLWFQEALFSLGHLYWNKGEIEDAEAYFRKLAGQSGPLAVKGKLYMAKILSQKGEKEKALALYNELSENDSVSGIALLNKAFLLKDLKQYSEAVEDFYKVIKSGFDNPEIRFSLALCLEKTGDVDRAIGEYFKAIYEFSEEKDSLSSQEGAKNYAVKSYFRLAKLYEKKSETKEAARIYQKIIDLGVSEAKIAEKRLEELGVE